MFKKNAECIFCSFALSLLFVKEAKADQVTEEQAGARRYDWSRDKYPAVSAINKAEVDAAKDSLDQKNEQVKEEEAAVRKRKNP